MGVNRAEPAFELRLVLAEPCVDLPAISPRRAKADGVGFHECGDRALFGEMERGRQPRKAAPDDADVRAERVLEGGMGRKRPGADRVIALGRRRHDLRLKAFSGTVRAAALGACVYGSYL